jgi:DNA end-binding protein Ku
MPPRSSFKGFLRLSLVSVPVKGFTATQTSQEIRLNQLHAECNSRVKYQKVCPTHGELSSDDIVSGYEYAKDQYVIIDPDEIAKIRKESDKSIDVRGFVKQDAVDPMYFSGRTYYLLPDGPAGGKPYQLLHDAMKTEELYAIGTAILSGRQQVVVVRPVEGLLGMTVLLYHEALKRTSEFDGELKQTKVTKEEAALTKTLVDASKLADFDLSEFKDPWVTEMTQLVEMKVEGKEIVAAPEPEEPKIINLMDALKASVENARAGGGVAKPKTAAKRAEVAKARVKTKMAPSAKAKVARKKKSG